MKKLYTIIGIITIISVLLILFYKYTSNFPSQKNSANTVKEYNNTGISSELTNFLSSKSVISSIIEVNLIIYKVEKRLDFFVTDSIGSNHLMLSQSIRLSSTKTGTKLYNNDVTLPEGQYRIRFPATNNSSKFVINFPNEFDISKQQADKRPPLTSEITIGTHEDNIILDEAVFNKIILLQEVIPIENIKITIVPNDLRSGKPIPYCPTCSPWIEELYGSLRVILNEFK